MRIRWALAAVLVLTAACGSSAAAPVRVLTHALRPAAARCGPQAAKTLAADSRARIYAIGDSVYGCANGGRRAYLLGHRSRSLSRQSRIGAMALAGVVAAYGLTQSGVDTASTTVVVRRLDTGRTLHDVNAITGLLGPEFFEEVDALVVKADGAVAWIGRGSSILQKEATAQVNRIDRRGEATLERVTTGLIGALRLRGSRLSWRHGNAVRTSTLL